MQNFSRNFRNVISFLLLATALLIVLFFSWLMLEITVPFFSFRHDIGFLLTKQAVLHLVHWRLAFYLHIGASLPVLFTGAWQMSARLRRTFPMLHRVMGKVYIGIILFLSAPTGLVLAYHANGGLPAKLSFTLLSLLWWFFTFNSYRLIRQSDIEGHRKFMIRSYALTCSAIALRSYVYLLPMVSGMSGASMYIFVSWASWVPQLLLIEFFFLFQKRTTLETPAERSSPNRQ